MNKMYQPSENALYKGVSEGLSLGFQKVTFWQSKGLLLATKRATIALQK